MSCWDPDTASAYQRPDSSAIGSAYKVEYLSCNKPGFVSQIFPKGFDYAAEDAVMDRFLI